MPNTQSSRSARRRLVQAPHLTPDDLALLAEFRRPEAGPMPPVLPQMMTSARAIGPELDPGVPDGGAARLSALGPDMGLLQEYRRGRGGAPMDERLSDAPSQAAVLGQAAILARRLADAGALPAGLPGKGGGVPVRADLDVSDTGPTEGERLARRLSNAGVPRKGLSGWLNHKAPNGLTRMERIGIALSSMGENAASPTALRDELLAGKAYESVAGDPLGAEERLIGLGRLKEAEFLSKRRREREDTMTRDEVFGNMTVPGYAPREGETDPLADRTPAQRYMAQAIAAAQRGIDVRKYGLPEVSEMFPETYKNDGFVGVTDPLTGEFKRTGSLPQIGMHEGIGYRLDENGVREVGRLDPSVDDIRADELNDERERHNQAVEALRAGGLGVQAGRLDVARGQLGVARDRVGVSRESVEERRSRPNRGGKPPNTMEVIRSKIANGQALTPGEQKLYDDARQRGADPMAFLNPGGGVPPPPAPPSRQPAPVRPPAGGTAGTKANPYRPATPAEASRLPSGAYFRDGNGVLRRRP